MRGSRFLLLTRHRHRLRLGRYYSYYSVSTQSPSPSPATTSSSLSKVKPTAAAAASHTFHDYSPPHDDAPSFNNHLNPLHFHSSSSNNLLLLSSSSGGHGQQGFLTSPRALRRHVFPNFFPSHPTFPSTSTNHHHFYSFQFHRCKSFFLSFLILTHHLIKPTNSFILIIFRLCFAAFLTRAKKIKQIEVDDHG